MTDLQALIKDADAYAAKSGAAIATVSRKLFGDGTRIGKIREGRASALSSTVQRARDRLSALEADLADREPAQ